jgi:hypothetical protein
MQVSRLTFVGTVEEFAAVSYLFEEEHRIATRGPRPRNVAEQPPVSEQELIRRVLARMPVPPGQQALYRALYRAGDAGLGASELAAAIRRTEPELAGVLGALGRRINRTPGINRDNPPGVGLIFGVVQKDGQWHYTMKDELREVLKTQQPTWL